MTTIAIAPAGYRTIPITRYGTRDVVIWQDGVAYRQRHMIRLSDGSTATFALRNDNRAIGGALYDLQHNETHKRWTEDAFEYAGKPKMIPGVTCA